MSKNASGKKKGKKTIGSMIITILATIVVIIASLLGIGGEDAESIAGDTVNHIVNSEVVSDVDEDVDAGQQEDTVTEEEVVVNTEPEEEAPVEDASAVPEESSDESVSEEQNNEVVSEEEMSETEQAESEDAWAEITVAEITFRSQKLLDQHYDKHGIEMGFASAEEYELAAYKVTLHPDTLHKIEEEDGDDVFYREETNEFVVVSQDGYIRTYFNPSAGIDYYNRQ
ncbi:MAG: hypothetical protein IJA29_06020 [Lachnospiraceae bacterium]|nr:hypothetical protein [Lachnospiraceae bacterium]